MDCSPPAASVHGILQARVLEWIAFYFSSCSGGRTQVGSGDSTEQGDLLNVLAGRGGSRASGPSGHREQLNSLPLDPFLLQVMFPPEANTQPSLLLLISLHHDAQSCRWTSEATKGPGERKMCFLSKKVWWLKTRAQGLYFCIPPGVVRDYWVSSQNQSALQIMSMSRPPDPPTSGEAIQ